MDCAEYFNVNSFHTIDADDPLFDEEMIISLDLLRSKDCDVVYPTESSSAGGASVGYSLTTAIIKKAIENLDPDIDTEMMWFFLEKVDQIKMINLPDINNKNTGVRLTLDYEEVIGS